jgi:hypothetical protein
MASSSVIDGLSLGQWCSEQRSLYGRGKLSDECVERLQALPGWEWDRHDANWEYMFTLLQRFVAREGTALVPREHLEEGKPLGRWVRKQRDVYKGVHGGGRLRKRQWKSWSLSRGGHGGLVVMLGQWVGNQRQRYRCRWMQAHRPQRIARLEALRGWTWRRRPCQ